MINRAVRFYFEKSKDIYNEEYRADYSLDGLIYPVYNPVIPAVNTLTALTLQQNIKLSTENESDSKLIQAAAEQFRLQEIKYSLLADLLLYDEAVIFVNWINKTLERYQPGWLKIERDRTGKITAVSVTGEINRTRATRRYYLEDGYCYYRDNQEPPQPTGLTFLPFAITSSSYDLEHLLDIADDVNAKKAWLKNIFKMHGNPILNSPDALDIKAPADNNKGYKILAGADLRYMEMTGNIARLMKEEITELKEDAANEYPESALSRVLSGSNISEGTSQIRFTDLFSRINRLRGEFESLLSDAFNKLLLLDGRNATPTVVFEPVLPVQNNYDNELKIADLLTKYKELGSLEMFNEHRERCNLPRLDNTQFADIKSAV